MADSNTAFYPNSASTVRPPLVLSPTLTFTSAEAGRATLLVPAIVFAELGYLAKKGRIDTNLQEAHQYLLPYPCISEHPLTFRTVEAAFSIHDVPELHDRLIAGSAHELGIPVITNDPAMEQSSQVATLWR